MTNTSVTNIYSGKLAWLIARHLLEAPLLANGIQIKTWGYCFPELRVENSALERLLRRDLPEMTECAIREYVVEVTSPLTSAEVHDRLRLSDQPSLPGRTTRIVPTLFTTLTAFPCGFGVISEHSAYQFFRHSLPLETIEDEDQLREVFWKEINSSLPAPFYAGAEPEPKPMSTVRGTLDEYKETLEALANALTDDAAGKTSGARGIIIRRDYTYVITAARSKRSAPKVTCRGYNNTGDLQRALEIITSHYHPFGTTLANKPSLHGHAGHANSNFKLVPMTLNFEASEDPPARVRMAALGHIRRWFTEHAPDKIALVDKLCGESTPIDDPEETLPHGPVIMNTITAPAFGASAP